MATGLKIDTITGVLGRRIAKLKQSTQASSFRPELERHVSRVLTDCIAMTPARPEAKITAAQRGQYKARINAIPSVHTLTDPALRVNDMGEEWIHANGKWYRSDWHLPDEVYAAYQQLAEERARRMSTLESEFIANRLQARWLYQRSWWQVAKSLGIALSVAAQIIASHTRRKPAKEPPKGYGQWRGGKSVLSVVIRNPFLDAAGRYWNGNGQQILAQSTAKNLPRFQKEVNDKIKREISAARQVK